MLLRVGACRHTGSRISGATHIRQRLPCCWKWTSSIAHRSILFPAARRWSFFYRRLRLRVGLSNFGTRFAQTETEASEHSLALAYLQRHIELLLHKAGQQR